MKRVFEEVNANGLKLKNRLVRSATWEGLGKPDGSLPEEVYEIYEELAKGGVGAIITGFTSVSADDFYFDGMMRLSSDALIPQYKRLTDIIHKESCPVIAQLALGAFYRVYDGEAYEQTEPDEMTKDEIRQVVRIFREAARRAKEAGFDGVQMRIGETTGGARCPVDIGFAPTGAERRPVEGRGSRNPYSPGSYRTAGGSRVQNREIESENPYEKVTKIVTKIAAILIG